MIMILLLKLMNYFSSKRGEYDHLEIMMNHVKDPLQRFKIKKSANY